MTVYVFVVNAEGVPLMPTSPSRARRWIKSGKATAFFRKGVFCVRLNVEPSDSKTQEIVVGIDPGSKKEAFTIKSEAHTFLSIQTDAVTWVKDKIETRRNMRRTRRTRKTPYRKCRWNRTKKYTLDNPRLSPSTRARWGLKIRISTWIKSFCPVSCFVVEDIKARTRPGTHRGARHWNCNFSPLEVGKHWFYRSLRKLARVETQEGHETYEMRRSAGLSKSSQKLSNNFNAHCVDSWVLANWWVGGGIKPENFWRIILKPAQFFRRQLHTLQPAKGGLRRNYGSTRSLGFKRMSLVTHPKFGLVTIGGTSNGRVSLHDISRNKRLAQNAKIEDISFLSFLPWSYFYLDAE